MYRSLRPDGYPVNPRSFFIGIRREVIRDIDFLNAMYGERVVIIPVSFLGEWKYLRGVVQHINQFHDGMVVHLKPVSSCLLQAWPSVVIWVSRFNCPSGVLS